jgi:hypothetical protein
MHTLVLAPMSGTLTFVDAAIGVAIAGVLAMLVAMGRRRRREAHEAWVANAALTEGTVVQVRESGDVDTVTEYMPVVAYRVDGQEYSIDGKSSTVCHYEVGARVTVAYEPRRPSSARIARLEETTGYERKMGLAVLVFVAVVATVVSALVRS